MHHKSKLYPHRLLNLFTVSSFTNLISTYAFHSLLIIVTLKFLFSFFSQFLSPTLWYKSNMALFIKDYNSALRSLFSQLNQLNFRKHGWIYFYQKRWMHPNNWPSTIIPKQPLKSLLLLIITDAPDIVAWTIYTSTKDTSFLDPRSWPHRFYLFHEASLTHPHWNNSSILIPFLK